jgi:hypothetical protein
MKGGMAWLLLPAFLAAGASGAATLTIGTEELSSGEPLCVS